MNTVRHILMLKKNSLSTLFILAIGLLACQTEKPTQNQGNVKTESQLFVQPYGGSDGIGEILSFDSKTNQIEVISTFTNLIPGKNPVSAIEKSDGTIIVLASGGGKYQNGVFLTMPKNSSKFTVLLEIKENIGYDKMVVLNNHVYFTGYDHDTKERKLFYLDETTLNIRKIAVLPRDSRDVVVKGEELYIYGDNIYVWRSGQKDIVKVVSLDQTSISSMVAYQNMLVGTGTIATYGPPENPFINPKGMYFFSFDPEQNEIIRLAEIDIIQYSNIAIQNNQATIFSGKTVYQLDLSSNKLITFDTNSEFNEIKQLTVADDGLYGFSQVKKGWQYVFINLTNKEITSRGKTGINPKTVLLTSNDRHLQLFFGDLTSNKGSIKATTRKPTPLRIFLYSD